MDPKLERAVIAEITDELGIDPAGVNRASRLAEDLAVDSLEAVELMMRIEDAFGLRLPEADVASLRTVGDVIDLIGRVAAGDTDGRGRAG
jgi:acyl carrier protein